MGAAQKRLIWAGVILGIGLMGALDGIIFHQLLQWHSVYMPTDSHGRILSDGLFHAFTIVVLVAGILYLWRIGQTSGLHGGWREIGSGVLMGAGFFNLAEGLVNHQILGIHHVKQGDPNEFAYDMAFLASGVLLFAIGWLLRKREGDRKEAKGREKAL
ncbi:membrane protein [Paenibacillus sp. J31TS4]|uniref:DUF2243 domain-containing protein n=1 Tax=Paenibacillus sp. J31TS4 TaxID=2807195 RepID=UPI001B201D42|nr:DUF2243 domain-containing protein [Paenibacillus sp. J31TS4]GIP38751.1 membrane protein [Paenibacillus sp. J31TS4]